VPAELVEHEIRRFLASKDPEVICISGRWGVGKTYGWNRYLGDAEAQNGIALERYSYVSLFGINSLDELRYSIFENSVKASDIGVELSVEMLQSNSSAAANRIGRKLVGLIQQTPYLKNYVGGLSPMLFSSVREMVICLDDVERRGDHLSAREVLGLVSTLKELKGCKVALILNDEALGKDEDEFRKYYEKVVDISLKFDPSPQESARIALTGDAKGVKLLAENCVTLGIQNIRLIKRIERSVRAVETMLVELDEQVLKQAGQSLALLGWSIFEPSRAPSLDYLQHRRGGDAFVPDKNKIVPEEEAAWNALLDAYGFSGMDALDLVLLDGVRDGFFDPRFESSQLKKLWCVKRRSRILRGVVAGFS
jgi:hypothetical protein